MLRLGLTVGAAADHVEGFTSYDTSLARWRVSVRDGGRWWSTWVRTAAHAESTLTDGLGYARAGLALPSGWTMVSAYSVGGLARGA